MESNSGVSALLLTIGESTFADAQQALQAQTIPLHQIIVIRNERPFTYAFNLGVSSINTEFFIQCDADMILDPNCVEVLMSRMKTETGMVVGYLSDPLQGRVRGIKLYRTDCCKRFPLEDSSNCEEIFRTELIRNHWAIEIIKNCGTLGKHEPDPTDSVYQFERFKYQGAKIYARKAWDDLAYRLIRLARAGDSPLTALAISAMVCGLYIVQKEDHLRGFSASPEYRLWEQISGKSDAPKEKFKVYRSIGSYNFLLGYTRGFFLRRRRNHIPPEGVIHQCMHSVHFPDWAYLLGFCSAITLRSESIRQNILTRSFRIRPFLRYFSRNLDHFLRKD